MSTLNRNHPDPTLNTAQTETGAASTEPPTAAEPSPASPASADPTTPKEVYGMARDRAGETVEDLRESYARLRDEVDDLSEQVEDFVQDNPGQAVLVAAGVGFILGLAWSRLTR
ncbi:MAG: hypothetical protein AAGD38_12120 [Acidobacteriota bacterium]